MKKGERIDAVILHQLLFIILLYAAIVQLLKSVSLSDSALHSVNQYPNWVLKKPQKINGNSQRSNLKRDRMS